MKIITNSWRKSYRLTGISWYLLIEISFLVLSDFFTPWNHKTRNFKNHNLEIDSGISQVIFFMICSPLSTCFAMFWCVIHWEICGSYEDEGITYNAFNYFRRRCTKFLWSKLTEDVSRRFTVFCPVPMFHSASMPKQLFLLRYTIDIRFSVCQITRLFYMGWISRLTGFLSNNKYMYGLKDQEIKYTNNYKHSVC